MYLYIIRIVFNSPPCNLKRLMALRLTCQAMNGLLDLRLLTLALDELVEVLFVFGRETLDKFVGDLGLVHDGNVKVVGGFSSIGALR